MYSGWVPSAIVDIFADNMAQRTATAMKSELERGKKDLNLSNLSVEEAAKRMFAAKVIEDKKKEYEIFQQLIDDPKVTKPALEERIRLLEKQLRDASTAQMPQDVLNSIEEYLRRTKERLKRMV
jgi:DNA-binding transcriptional regulator PaaX